MKSPYQKESAISADRLRAAKRRHLMETEGKMNLCARLKHEAIANAERDLGIAAEWFRLEKKRIQPKKGRRNFGRAIEDLRDETAKTAAGKLIMLQIDAEITAARRDRRMPKWSSKSLGSEYARSEMSADVWKLVSTCGILLPLL